LLYSIVALVMFVLYDTAGRTFASRSENPRVFATIFNLVAAVIAPLLLLFDSSLPTGIDGKVIGLTIVGLLIWALWGRFEYFARKHTEASTFTIMIKLAPVINFFLALIVLDEQATFSKFVGIGLIIIANFLLFVGNERRSVVSDKGLKYMILVALLISMGWLFDAINVKSWGVAAFATMSFLAPALLSGLIPLVKKEELHREISLTPIWEIGVLAALNVFGYGAMLKALTLGEASKVMPIVTSTSPFVVLLGVWLLKERKHLGRKAIAAGLTMGAMYLLR